MPRAADIPSNHDPFDFRGTSPVRRRVRSDVPVISGLESTVERIAGAQFARESLALKKNNSLSSSAKPLVTTRPPHSIGIKFKAMRNGMYSSAGLFWKDMRRLPRYRPKPGEQSKLFLNLL
jgi:hypothetical protein